MGKQIKIAILADGKEAVAEFKSVGAASKFLADENAKAASGFQRFRGHLDSLSGGLKSAGSSMMGLGRTATFGMTAPIVGAFAGMISAAQESAKITAITGQIIKQTGGAAKLTAEQVSRLSTSLSNKTGIDDEVIQKGQNVLLTFTKIHDEAGKGNDVFSRASMAMLDLGTVFGSSDAAAMQLGKALNDPVKGITALGKAGVSFSVDQQVAIKTMMAHNDILGAQKIILGEVEAQVGGTAAASSTAYDRMKVSIGNLGETLGAVLLPWVEKVSAKVSEWAAKWDDLSPKMQKIIMIGAGVAAALGPVLAVVGALVTAIGVLVSPIGLAVVAIAALAAGAVYAYTHFQSFRNVVDGVVQWLRSNVPPAFEAVKNAITTAVTAIKRVWDDNWQGIKTVTAAVFDAVKAVVSSAMGVIKGLISAAASAIKGDWSGALEGIKAAFSSWKDGVVGVVRALGPLLLGAMRTAMEGLKSAIIAGTGIAVNFMKQLPGKLVSALGNLSGLLVNAGKQLLDGLVKGIASGFGAVQAKLGELTGKLTSWKGPESVDKTLLTPVGKMIIDGLVAGFDQGFPAVKGKLNEFTKAIQEGANNKLSLQQWQAMGEQISAKLAGGIKGKSADVYKALAKTVEDAINNARQKIDSAISSFGGAVSSGRGLKSAQNNVATAEQALADLRNKKSTLPTAIIAAEAKLEKARAAAAQTTAEEQVAIEQATEALKKAEEQHRSGEITAAALEVAQRNLTRAQGSCWHCHV
jgi:hypothetical protein